ncbi:hypothetical protein B0H13DRAFT_1870081 [Mycena leptocephala]|nr:hypothetical protein B0H13DRAFT_1870081 [Mycena leptocephala]
MLKATACRALVLLLLSTCGVDSAQIPLGAPRPALYKTTAISPLVSPTNFAGCNASQISELKQAFKDAALLTSKGININSNWMASLEFFGPPGYIDGGNRSIIQDNFARAAAYQPRWDDWLRNSPTTSAYHITPEPKPYQLLDFCPSFSPNDHWKRRFNMGRQIRNVATICAAMTAIKFLRQLDLSPPRFFGFPTSAAKPMIAV